MLMPVRRSGHEAAGLSLLHGDCFLATGSEQRIKINVVDCFKLYEQSVRGRRSLNKRCDQ
jgi:hypothetical protein